MRVRPVRDAVLAALLDDGRDVDQIGRFLPGTHLQAVVFAKASSRCALAPGTLARMAYSLAPVASQLRLRRVRLATRT